MPAGRPDLSAVLDQLCAEFLAALPSRMQAVENAWARLETGDTAAREALVQAVHYLVGSGATFRQPGISQAARTLEEQVMAGGGAPESGVALQALRDAVAAALA
ncbi:MAG TPA: Hpt domain-containing protein [Azospirillaceae bacterium]|nr:Hpt domain-containing protein [Azospirillaceae bacterium]